MRLFKLWFRHEDSEKQLLAVFRMQPGRKVWDWFTMQRNICVITMDPNRFQISSSSLGLIAIRQVINEAIPNSQICPRSEW